MWTTKKVRMSGEWSDANLSRRFNDLAFFRNSKQKRLKRAKSTGLFPGYRNQISRSQSVLSSGCQPSRRQMVPSHSRQPSVTPHNRQSHSIKASNAMADDSVGPRVNDYGGLEEDEDDAERDSVLEIRKGDRTTSNGQVRT